jgi:hypothetical protein
MTVAANAGYRKDYTGNGVTVNWPVPFYFLDASHLQVILTNISVTPNVSTSLTLNSDYTVDGAGTSSSGSITTMVAYSSSYKITILRNVPLGQDTHYVEGDKFPASGHEQALDKLTMIVQQQAEVVGRAVTLPPSSNNAGTLPNPSAGQLLGWDAAGVAIVNYPPTTNSAQALQVSLADVSSAANGAGMVGHTFTVAYGFSTVGGKVNLLGSVVSTGGTAPAFTLSPVTPLPSYASTNPPIRVRWSANAVFPTVNVSGLGNRSVMVRNSLGVKIPPVVFAGQESTLVDDGTHLVMSDAIQPRNQGDLVNYKASCSGLSASINMSADLVTVRDVYGSYIELSGVSVTLNTAGSGAGGLDTSTIGANTWYHKFIIYNPTGAVTAALCSLSPTSPTMPAGYTHWKRTGAFRSDGTANKWPLSMVWNGDWAQYKPASGSNLTSLFAAATGTSVTYPTAIALGAYVPPTAIGIQVEMMFGNGASPGWASLSPNAQIAQAAAPLHMVNGGASGITINVPGRFVLESTNLYWGVSNASACTVAVHGWEDAI